MTDLKFPKRVPFRDPEWLASFNDRVCILTGSPHPDPAHIRYGWHGQDKPHDNWTLPLAHDLHRRQHCMGEVAFWRQQMSDPVLMTALIALAEKHHAAWAHGERDWAVKLLKQARER